MKMFLLKTVLFLFLINISISAQSVGLNFSLAFPQGDFKQNVDKVGFGLSLEGVYFFNPLVGIGLNGGFYNYGSEQRSAAWSTTIPDVTLQVSRTNNIGNLHLFFRIAPPYTLVKPYIDLLFGGSYLWTDTKVYSQKGNHSEEEIATTENLGDYAWSYGFGGGLMFKVASIPIDKGARMGEFIY